MNKQEKLAAIRRVIGHEEFQKGSEAVFFCPRHRHHKAKLSINLDSDYFHCWICDWRGNNLKPILFLNGKTDDAARYSSENQNSKQKPDEVIKVFDAPVLPDSFRLLVKDNINNPYMNDARSYLESRGISDTDILKYKIGFCIDGDYKYRVVFPSFDSYGELNFFVGRKIYEHIGLSYKHGNFNKNIIFNDYLIDWDKPVILVEGPFDAIIAGENSIPLQGKTLREDSELFSKIVTSKVDVFLALDSDAKSEQIKLANKFLRYGVKVNLIDVEKFGESDVADLGKERFKIAFEASENLDPIFGLIELRIRNEDCSSFRQCRNM